MQIVNILVPVAEVIKRKIGDRAACFSDAIVFISKLLQRCFPMNKGGKQYTACPLLKQKAPIRHKTSQGASHGECICRDVSGITPVSCSSPLLPLRYSPLTHGISPPAIR